MLVSTSLSQISKSYLIYREKANCSSILGGHVADSSPICESQIFDSRSIELYEFIDNSFFSEYFCAE